MQGVFLYNKSNPYGIAEDVRVFEEVLRKAAKEANIAFNKVRHSDPLEVPILCDVAFHFEIPVYSYFPWARRNVILVNPEWWEDGWDAYLHHADILLFKCQSDQDLFMATRGQHCRAKPITLPWTTSVQPDTFTKLPKSVSHTTPLLWFLGASQNKRAAAQHILPLWKEEWPLVHVYTTTSLNVSCSSNVTIHVQDLPEQTRRSLQTFHPGHLIFSQAEALGMAAMEAQAAGAFLIGNQLPVFREVFTDRSTSALTLADLTPLKAGMKDTFSLLTQEAIEEVLEQYKKADLTIVRDSSTTNAIQRYNLFVQSVTNLIREIKDLPGQNIRTLPPVLSDAECPPISIITLLHNRRKFVELALHNLLLTDYPKDKIEWVVVEDSDKVEEQASDKIMKFGRECSPMSVTYIPLQKVVSIGEKRNLACKRAQHNIILMMDDDDHYPPTSFRRRVAWLLKHPMQPQALAATTIACYDLLKGTSAVNTPPFTLGLDGRVSEATLTFTKQFWEARPFPQVNMSEGEGFLTGRCHQVLEIQPQQIIVAMSHGLNASSRRIPPGPSGQPSCFWGFPKEFLVFLHRLAGVEIEEINSSSKSKK